jgi:DNA-binding transcriptional regulator PaaX
MTKRKGDILCSVLKALGRVALGASDLFEIFLQAGYGASISRFEHVARKIESRRLAEREKQRIRQNYYATLSRLKKDGLIKTENIKANKLFFITAMGRQKLSFLQDRDRESLPRTPKAEAGDKFIIVAFDVPEKEKRKRNWLRYALRYMGLVMIQRSVWAGKVKLPEDFLHSLRKLKLLDCVEIFEISKTGTLEQIE